MCGILGANISNKEVVREAIDLFSYRGPDSTGIFSDKEVTFGFKRLAIIDLDQRSNQPMQYKHITVIFNGEIYNYKILKAELEKTYTFQTDSDTEVIIFAYMKWGTDMVSRLKGMYAISLYDAEKKKVYLFRDHVGIKPLYYYHKDDLFIFASEVKGVTKVLKSLNKKVDVDRGMLDFYPVLAIYQLLIPFIKTYLGYQQRLY